MTLEKLTLYLIRVECKSVLVSLTPNSSHNFIFNQSGM